MNTANKNHSKEPSWVMPASTMVVKPAAGPLTLVFEALKYPTTKPPITPAITPESKGAPLANATPKQRGRATKKTTKPATKSFLTVNEDAFIL